MMRVGIRHARALGCADRQPETLDTPRERSEYSRGRVLILQIHDSPRNGTATAALMLSIEGDGAVIQSPTERGTGWGDFRPALWWIDRNTLQRDRDGRELARSHSRRISHRQLANHDLPAWPI